MVKEQEKDSKREEDRGTERDKKKVRKIKLFTFFTHQRCRFERNQAEILHHRSKEILLFFLS